LLHEPQLLAFRSRLDEGIWEKGFEEGQAMMLEEAIEYALSEEDSATPTPQALDSSVVRAQQPTLTRREEEVATLVAQGMTNRQIASELTISDHTAATHVRRILKKLGLSSRSQLSAWVTGQGLPSLDLG
jgi:DNA-binding NarL/FixJ family response regulator